MIIKKIKDGAINLIKKRILVFETVKVLVGLYYYKKFNKSNKKHLVIIRGATGDVYLQFLLLDEYIRQKNITNYYIIGDGKNFEQLAFLFNISNIKFLPVKICNCIEKLYIFSNGEGMNMILPFYWTDNFQFNRCRVRFSSKFNFMENYYWFSYSMKMTINFKRINFLNDKEFVNFIAQQKGIIKNKTILISPEANSVIGLPIWFWNSLINDLIAKGYYVFMNCNGFNYYRAPNLFLSYYESVPLLDYAGGFIGVRSGFCDIISTSKCKKVILYPKIKGKINFSYHRSDIEYSGLKVMGLSNGDNLYEIPTLLLKNITDTEYKINDFNEYFQELIELRKKILEVFE